MIRRLALFSVIALCAAWRPLGEAGALNDFRDSHLVHTYEDVAVRTVRDHGELPLWNPYSCGGMYALGNPQTRFASPTFLLSLAAGARRAEPLLLFLFLIAAMEGMYRFARLRTPSKYGPLVAAPLFALCGYGAIGWTLGWMSFLGGFLLVPWALYGTARLARGEPVGAVPLVLSAGMMLGLGGSYPLALTAVFCALEAVRELATRRRLQPLTVLAAAGLFTVGALAFRLWPVMETLAASPRVMAGRPGHSLQKVLAMLFWPAPGASGTEAIFAVAPIALLFAVVALVWRPKRALAPMLILAFAVWCATGYQGRSPYVWLRELPIFETLRYPERFLYPGVVYLAEAAGIGVSALLSFGRRKSKALTWATAALCLLAVGYGIFSFEVLSRRSQLAPMPPEVVQPFKQARGNRWIAGYYPSFNRGSLNCGEAYPVWMSPALRGDLPEEEYLEDPSMGTVRRAHWSPNRLELEVKLQQPGVVRVNQNWHPGWRTSAGEVLAREGLLAVSLPAGEHRVALQFRPRSAFGGVLVSALALILLAVWILRAPRWGLPLGLVPLAFWALLATVWPEPRVEPILQNPDGSPLLVESIPSDAIPLNVRFEEPIELVAARIAGEPDADHEVPLELFWRVDGAVPRTVGIFVHVGGPNGKRHGADHEVLGGTWFFRDAPQGQLIRDSVRVNTKDWEAGIWKPSIGLWYASGNGARLKALRPDGQALPDRRIEVGEIRIP